jgi:hypothetical protein
MLLKLIYLLEIKIFIFLTILLHLIILFFKSIFIHYNIKKLHINYKFFYLTL